MSHRNFGFPVHIKIRFTSLVAQLVKNPPAVQETWVGSLGWEDLLEKGNSYPLQYSGLKNSMDCIACGVIKSQTRLSDFCFHSIVYPCASIMSFKNVHIFIYKSFIICNDPNGKIM